MFWAYSYLYWLRVRFVSWKRMFWKHRSRFGHKSSITCLFVPNTVCSKFAPHQKRMFWGNTLKERGIVIFAWFLGSVFGLFHKSVCFGVIGLVFAPCSPGAKPPKNSICTTQTTEKFWYRILVEQYLLFNVRYYVEWDCGITREIRSDLEYNMEERQN